MVSVVYMVAGMSSRFGGKLKQFANVGPQGETLIEISLKQAIQAGVDEIIFIVGAKTEIPFREKFGHSYKEIPIRYAMQTFDEQHRDKPWGTTDALVSARRHISQPFIVCNGDDLYGTGSFKILVEQLNQGEKGVTLGYELGTTLPPQTTNNRGIFTSSEIEGKNCVNSIEERFELELENLHKHNLHEKSLCSMNIFGMSPEVLEMLSDLLDNFKTEHATNRRAECLLPIEMGRLVRDNKFNLVLHPTTDRWFGVTHPEDEAKVRAELLALDK